ncbi:glycosyltransferase [Comamonas aquatica]|uniref:glycosyltransferase family protein n=1 Tax=Comamonas aquatica TaxID=225991 RepID=UPI0024480490|nr:glycosyltransferase [Comamonas aquatica]MDH1765980.1 glycosyltransferase [Comamonas aquatica]
MLIKNANLAFRQKKYIEAIKLYEQAIEDAPGISDFIAMNIELAKRKLSEAGEMNEFKKAFPLYKDSTKNLENNINNNYCVNEYVKDIRFSKEFVNEDEYNKKSEDKDWDTRDLVSITCSNKNISIVNKIFIVPAINKPRNTTRYRAYNLASQLKRISSVEIVDYTKLPDNFFEEVSKEKCIIVCQRLSFSNKVVEDFLNKCRETPAIIIYDIDDQIFDSSELEDWRINDLPNVPDSYYKAMLYADHFFVSTKELRKKIETLFKRPVHIINNLLGDEVIGFSNKAYLNPIKNKEFTIGYASGSFTHDFDLAVALEGISLFLEKNEGVVFHCVGDVNLPKSFFEKFKNKIRFTKKCHWSDLPDILAGFDVQIIPLDTAPFNKYKSHIRFLESSIVGVPVIASNFGEQSLTIINGYTGLLVSNSKEKWFGALDWMHKNTLARKSMGVNSRNYVIKYWSEQSELRRARLKKSIEDASLGILRDKLSIIVVIYNPFDDIKALFESISLNINVPYELLIWINTSSEEINNYIYDNYGSTSYIINVGHNVGKAHAANHLFKVASDRFVVGLDDDYIVPEFWAEGMITASKAVPKLGWLSTNLTKDSSGIRGYGKSSTYPGGVSIYLPSGVGGWVVFTTESSRDLIGYYREHGLYGGIDGDFNRRARALGLTTGYVRNVVGMHKVQRSNSLAWELFKQRIQDSMRTHGKDSDLVTDKFVDFFKDRPKNLTCSVKISTSVAHDENVWGDTHYAIGLKSALEQKNYNVRIDKHENWYSSKDKDDVVIHLFGLHEYEPDPYSINIMWIISHVDKINKRQLLKYDFIFCASEDVLSLVRSLVPEIKSELLYQCTDEKVFFPNPKIEKDIDILFVGNSRRIYRDAVKYAVEGGFPIQIWGTKWEQFIPKKYIKGQSLNSLEVSDYYRRAKIVLNDHWPDQTQFGLVNNRVFDAFACGAFVLSDSNPGIKNIFKDVEIPVFSSASDFKNLLDKLLADSSYREDFVQKISKNVLASHTFTERAKKINDAVIYLINDYVSYKSEFLHKLRSSLNNSIN